MDGFATAFGGILGAPCSSSQNGTIKTREDIGLSVQ
jgi:hypothetical protein